MQFSGGRALETLVKQHAQMSLFVKHVAEFSDVTVDIMPSPCTASSHAISVKALVENSLGPRDPKHISRAE